MQRAEVDPQHAQSEIFRLPGVAHGIVQAPLEGIVLLCPVSVMAQADTFQRREGTYRYRRAGLLGSPLRSFSLLDHRSKVGRDPLRAFSRISQQAGHCSVPHGFVNSSCSSKRRADARDSRLQPLGARFDDDHVPDELVGEAHSEFQILRVPACDALSVSTFIFKRTGCLT